jgi:hypothetical protein
VCCVRLGRAQLSPCEARRADFEVFATRWLDHTVRCGVARGVERGVDLGRVRVVLCCVCVCARAASAFAREETPPEQEERAVCI